MKLNIEYWREDVNKFIAEHNDRLDKLEEEAWIISEKEMKSNIKDELCEIYPPKKGFKSEFTKMLSATQYLRHRLKKHENTGLHKVGLTLEDVNKWEEIIKKFI